MKIGKVALMVATYNGERVIEKCLRSLLATDSPDREVIVVDDGSADSTPEILKQFGDRITRLPGHRRGVAAGRNQVMDYTDAEFLATTDDDCEVQPDWISRAAGAFADPEIGAVTGEKIYKITNLVSAVRSREYWIRYRNRGREAKSVECPVTIFRIAALKRVGGFSVWTKVGGEDTDIGYKLLEGGHRIIFQPEMIVYHDSEESLRLYIKRNYRNARAYIRVFSTRDKEHSLNDDFFPWYIQFQPFFTIAFWLSSLAGFICPWIWLGSAIILIFINLTFLNITRQVFKTEGRSLKTLFLSNGLLFLRNTIWIGGFFAGLKNVILDRKKEETRK